MLEPREADIPALFLVLVVLPVVAYYLLGKWSEASKKHERVSLLAQLAAEEALRAETMAAASVIPLVPSSKRAETMAAAGVIPLVTSSKRAETMVVSSVVPLVPSLKRAETMVAPSVIPLVPSSKNKLHVCAWCFGPATTRCSRCKAVKYCSGRCQIIHWRQVHKEECLQLESASSSASACVASSEESALLGDNMNMQFGDCSTVNTSQVLPPDIKSTDRRTYRKSNREMLRKEDVTMFDSCEETTRTRASRSASNNISSDEAFIRHKSRASGFVEVEEGIKPQNANGSNMHIRGQNASTVMHESHNCQSQRGNKSESKSNYEFSGPPYSAKSGTSVHGAENAFFRNSKNLVNGENGFGGESVELDCSGMIAAKECIKARSSLHSLEPRISESTKLAVKVSGEQSCPEMGRKGQIPNELKVSGTTGAMPAPGISGVASIRIMEMMGLKKSSKLVKNNFSALCGERRKKIKMLFPYEEFINFFQCEVFDLSPRGLLNCGNSCYANAVLQCLTCTKPLSIYLLRRSHSRACYGKVWCLMCELEQHVMLLRERGGPLSSSRILSYIRSINCQMGDGSQEDAHEFLRLLVASMQSICLERLGGEHKVDPRLQETTFIQHTFGGRLRSKVKCLRCFHESERYENIMDLTLEIFGWVESLEDALTQFTRPEDLDGENMYRCGRCAGYVRAQKQLCIHEAPNILTIVLKRFQEGKYGKINKCITFSDMLDMVPFMTGTGDVPPLYMLYAVVVHLDTLNASFSGHYVTYVKDLRGNWFRIDDTEVHPVSMNRVMSEGAYILFYMRSCPRPQRELTEKSIRKQGPARQNSSETERPSRAAQSKSSTHSVVPKHVPDLRPEIATRCFNRNGNDSLWQSTNGDIAEPINTEFSDATSSDWSLFTSSDEASFTTESARDSFSTVDYSDASNGDPFSIFNNLPAPESSYSTVSCRFSTSRPHTRFALEDTGYVFDPHSSTQPENRLQEHLDHVGDSLSELSIARDNDLYVKYGNNPKNSHDRTARP
ncbi:Ubiquitin carboxyl-terminal hydrolase 19 [Hibiscus syriacus]|uniref:ubiquitinyl hydrolase 1 n=1 Tax=Hibiscus syriacus TaxID=106335 RepID=A0A6A2Y0Z9_HIBSY|nr:ubiquitin carboxyl-terminal hydrolase 15-like isoform X2 [Hibiscus syriacus]KAE8668876.1 Ubiquitin carboxyl-terminal hydrolase 19 [Hibiscus syriacus]